MILFWGTSILALLYYYAKKGYRSQKIKDNTMIFLMLSFAFLIVAIVTNDPIFAQFGVPMEFEWVVGLFLTGLSSWKLYFSPLKERVVYLEKNITSIKTGMNSISEDIHLIKEKLIK